ncbi:MAG: hypothetical protein HRU41_04380 [Saprospiraceae bacterium]|nr:hypothetical protein [Saprospiraceae bacterium]
MSNWGPLHTRIRNELVKLYPTNEDVSLIITDLGVDVSFISFHNKSRLTWQSTLKELLKHNKLGDLLDLVLSEYPENEILSEALDEIKGGKEDKASVSALSPPPLSVKELKHLISKSQTEEVISKLIQVRESLTPAINKLVSSLSSTFVDIRSFKIKGMLSPSEELTEMAKLRDRTLEVLDTIESLYFREPPR